MIVPNSGTGGRVILKSDLIALEADRLRALCGFTDQERQVFDLRLRGKSLVEISMELAVSTATVSRRIAAIGKKVKKTTLPKE